MVIVVFSRGFDWGWISFLWLGGDVFKGYFGFGVVMVNVG